MTLAQKVTFSRDLAETKVTFILMKKADEEGYLQLGFSRGEGNLHPGDD